MAICVRKDFELRGECYDLWIHDKDWWLLRSGRTYDNVDLKMTDEEIDEVNEYIERWGRR